MMVTSWPLLIVLGFGTLVTVTLLARTRTTRRIGRCPRNANTVAVEVQESPWTGTTLGVVSCSEFTPRTAVCCDRRCLKEGRR